MKTTPPPAPDMLKQRADFLATHLTAVAHMAVIKRLRRTGGL